MFPRFFRSGWLVGLEFIDLFCFVCLFACLGFMRAKEEEDYYEENAENQGAGARDYQTIMVAAVDPPTPHGPGAP